MVDIKLDDTIAAISTPVGEGGIGIVRMSGKDALKIADRVFLSRDTRKPSTFKTYTTHYGHIVDKRQDGIKGKRYNVIDEVILTVMRAPKSYTREDIVEINCHSGIVPLKKILDIVLSNGARLAQPGEFTRRAFLNGRIDILQAEAVLDIVRAKTDLALRAAINSLGGMVSEKINKIRDELMELLARIEASIDFAEEEDVDRIKKNDFLNRLYTAGRHIERLLCVAQEGRVLRHGINTVILGSPNVGKSSLMNALLRESRAIVTPLPGTTRDTIEEVVNVRGIPVVLVDTAGITRSTHPALKAGVKRSRFCMQKADMVLLVLDYAKKLSESDLELMHDLQKKENVIVVINKRDLKKHINIGVVKRLFPRNPVVYVSATNLFGIDKLEDTIQDIIYKGKAPTANYAFISNDRQIEILRRSQAELREAIGAIKDRVTLDCVAIYIRASLGALGEITGHTITEEALDRIFSEFCIGK